MIENKETEVINNEKTPGLSVASMVLGIVSIVTWCAWFISIPCSILALIFGILGVKKPGKGMAITGIVTGSIVLAIWVLVFLGAFMTAFMTGFMEEFSEAFYY